MEAKKSEALRKHGDSQAFDDGAWEFRSRQFVSGAKQLLATHDSAGSQQSWDSIMCLPTAAFLLALAIEQISKAYYLRRRTGPLEAIYSHSVGELCHDKVDEKQSS